MMNLQLCSYRCVTSDLLLLGVRQPIGQLWRCYVDAHVKWTVRTVHKVMETYMTIYIYISWQCHRVLRLPIVRYDCVPVRTGWQGSAAELCNLTQPRPLYNTATGVYVRDLLLHRVISDWVKLVIFTCYQLYRLALNAPDWQVPPVVGTSHARTTYLCIYMHTRMHAHGHTLDCAGEQRTDWRAKLRHESVAVGTSLFVYDCRRRGNGRLLGLYVHRLSVHKYCDRLRRVLRTGSALQAH